MTEFDSIFSAAAQQYGVPQAVIEAVARTESNLNPLAVGDDGASYGLFQMFRSTAQRYGVTNMQDLLDPTYATDKAVHYMADIIQHQGGLNLPDFYSEYNSGRALAWQTSTQVYQHVQNFLRNYALSLTPSDAVGVGVLGIGLTVFLLWRFRKSW